MAEQLAELKVQRASTKGCISRIKTFVEQKSDTLTPPEIECRLGILESYFKQALSYQTSIERLVPTDVNEVKVRSELEEVYCAIKSKLLSLRSDMHKQSLDSSQIVVTSPPINNLPKLRLPQFSGKYSEFQNFWGCFTKLVHKNETLTDLERFNHLLSCLSGAALRTVKALEISEDNYSKALEHLKAWYDNRYLIFQEHIVDLFNLPKISKTSPDQLRHLIDSANAHLSAIKSLGSSEDIANAFLIHIVTSKLDYESQDSWEAIVDFSTLPSWSHCFDILSKRCQYLESRDSKSSWSGGTSSHNQRNKQKVGKKPNIHATTLTTTNNSCAFCSESGHNIYKCQNFLALPVSERFNETKRRSLCVNCLSKGHTVKKCRVQKCRVCSMPHHTLLHRYTLPMSSQADLHVACPVDTVNDSRPNKSDNRAAANNTSLQTLLKDKNSDHVFLATAIIKVRDKFGCEHQARVLLDSASQLNFITERFAQYLQLSREKVETSISGIGDISSRIRYSTQATIQSLTSSFQTSLQMYIIPNITGSQPERKIDIDNWGIPGNVQLADPLFFEPQEVDLLVGADLFFQLLCVGQIKLSEGLPILQKTLFGWIVAGRYTSRLTPTKYSGYPVLEERKDDESSTDVTLFNLVERFWAEEDLGMSRALHTEEQELCEAMFKEKVQRLSDGKFMVKLPFRNEPRQSLGQSLRIARNRLQSLERKLDKNPKLKANYTEFLQDYLESGHMEAIEMENIPELHYFMPHQCVLRPESTTTKLRVVFDASCKTSSNNSLNDLLMTGPTVQDDIFSIILRFRSYKFALTADIQQMYRQILVYPEDRNFQLILWRASHSDNLQVFKLNTVTYGTTSAPFLATRCLIQLAEDFSSTMSEASRIIQKDFYMDDLITGADTSENLHRIKEEVDFILSSAQFKLRKWYSNDADLLSKIPEDAREKPLKFNDVDIVKTLGIVWDPAADNFKFNYKPSTSDVSRITKRKVLSDTASLFDPLGIINPIIVKAKVFLQELWILKLNWDESLPMELENRWIKFIEELSQLQYLEVPRLAFSSGSVTTTELHGYADASIIAYGCCLYIRSINAEGQVTTTLLAAKSKVAPIRTARSLPCLELCAALLLSRLLKKIRTSLYKTVDQTFLWTDSEIVLDWLACHPSMWKAYVANRVSEIQELTKDSIWRHVNSKANPADIISRGSSVAELSSSIWFSGPVYLQ